MSKRARVALAIGLALTVIGGVALALRLSDLDAHARLAAIAALDRALGLHAQIAHAELSLVRGELLASGVELRDAKGRSVLRARELRIAGSWTGLLGGQIDLRSVRVSGVRATFGERELRALEAAAKRNARPPFDTLDVSDSALTVELPELGKLELEALRLALQAQPERLQLKLDAGRARFALPGAAPLALGALHVAGTGDAHGLQLSQATLTRGSARVLFEDARLRFPLGRDAEARVEVDGELAALLELVPEVTRPALAGSVKLVGSLGRTDGRWSGEGRVALVRVALRGARIAERTELSYRVSEQGIVLDGRVERAQAAACRLQATLRVDGAALELAQLSVSAGQSTLTGNLRVDAAGSLSAQLGADDVRIVDVAPLLGLDPQRVPLDGRGKLVLRAHGAAAAPELAIELSLAHASLAGVALGTLDASLELVPADGGSELRVLHARASEQTRTLSTEGLRLRWPAGKLEANGKVALTKVALSDLYRALGAGDDALLARLQADARGQLELVHTGTTQKLGLALELAQPSLDGHDFDSGKLDAQVSLFDGASGTGRSALELKALDLRSGDGRLALAGKVARGGALDLHVTLQAVSLSRLTGNDWPWSALHAVASGQGTFGGSVQEPRAKLALELDDVQFGGIALGRQPLQLELARARGAEPLAGCDAALRALGELNGSAWLLCGGRGGAKIDLALGTAPSRPLRGRVELDAVDISRWLPVDGQGAALPGTLSAALALDAGGLASPQSISGRLDVRALALGKGQHALRAAAPFTVRIARGALSVENGQLIGDRVQLKLGAQGALPDVRLTADGTLAVSTLARAGLVPLVREAYGDVGVHVEVAPGHLPLLRAGLELRDLIVHVGPDLIVNKVRGKIAVVDDQARVEQIHGEVGGGTLELGGELHLGGLSVTRYDISLDATKVALEPQPRFEIAFDAKTRLQSGEKGRPPRVSGNFKVARLIYGRHIQLPEALVAMNKNDRSTRSAYDPSRDRLLVDIVIEHTQPLVMRNNFIDAELSLRGAQRTLRVVGSDQRFGLLGELAVDRGRVMYHGDEFQITRGAVSFADPERVDPVFDLRAVAQKQARPDASVIFSARGDRDAFQIDVRCDAGDTPLASEPFDCDFARDKLRCDDFDKLVEQFVCRPKTELSSAEPER